MRMQNNVLGAANLPAIYQKDTHTYIPHTEKGKWQKNKNGKQLVNLDSRGKYVCHIWVSKAMDAAGRDSLCFKIDQ